MSPNCNFIQYKNPIHFRRIRSDLAEGETWPLIAKEATGRHVYYVERSVGKSEINLERYNTSYVCY